MILKTIYLKIGESGVSKEYAYSFLSASRFICNFLEREVLKRAKFRALGFDRISISLCVNPSAGANINIFHVACVQIGYKKNEIDGAAGADLALLQIGLLKEGINKCALQYVIPEAELIAALDNFCAGGLKNTWLYKRKVFRAENLTVALYCEMTQVSFKLRLLVCRQDSTVWDEVILETPPDELLFEDLFKDIIIVSGSLTITGVRGRKLWSKALVDVNQDEPTGQP